LEVRQNTAATPIARVASDRAHGVNFFLRPQV
jgi:hypothetical protein